MWNRTKSKLDKVIAKGAIAADTPTELAARCDYVFMCLMDAASIETVVFGENGVCRSGNPKILVDFGTIHPDTCRDFAARLVAQNGTTWVDAPISGGVAGVADGTLAISDVAASVGARIPMTDQALKILRDASDHGDEQRDISSIIKVFDRGE